MSSASAFFTNMSADDRHRRRELAARVNGLQEREVVPLAGRVVVRAERRRHVHHAGSVVGRHELFADDHLVVRPAGILEPVERPAIARTDEIGAAAIGRRSSHRSRSPRRARRAARASARMMVRRVLSLLASCAQLDVLELGMHRERHVRHERPRRRRPHENAPPCAVAVARRRRARCRRSDPRRPRSPARPRGSTAPCRTAGSTAGSCGRDRAAPCRTASPAPTTRSRRSRSCT